MDRSDVPLQAAADPPTVRTEPTRPTTGAERADAPERERESGAPAHDAIGTVVAAASAPEEPYEGTLSVPALHVASPFDDAPLSRAPIAAPRSGRWRPPLSDWNAAEVKAICVRAAKVAGIVFSAWLAVVFFLVAVYRFVNPPFSTLMVLQWLGGTGIEREWVPIESISPNLRRAVIASEDGRFCSHWGIDFAEVAAALRRTSQGVPRGASTITMQVAKNLFLWPAKSYVRKIIEVPLTYWIELLWPKRRILEVYLNIAEWGPGIFGAEAAARAHFNRSASRLSARQAAQLAVALPNPIIRDAGDPGPWSARRASVIQRRMARSPEAARCVVPAQ